MFTRSLAPRLSPKTSATTLPPMAKLTARRLLADIQFITEAMQPGSKLDGLRDMFTRLTTICHRYVAAELWILEEGDFLLTTLAFLKARPAIDLITLAAWEFVNVVAQVPSFARRKKLHLALINCAITSLCDLDNWRQGVDPILEFLADSFLDFPALGKQIIGTNHYFLAICAFVYEMESSGNSLTDASLASLGRILGHGFEIDMPLRVLQSIVRGSNGIFVHFFTDPERIASDEQCLLKVAVSLVIVTLQRFGGDINYKRSLAIDAHILVELYQRVLKEEMHATCATLLIKCFGALLDSDYYPATFFSSLLDDKALLAYFVNLPTVEAAATIDLLDSMASEGDEVIINQLTLRSAPLFTAMNQKLSLLPMSVDYICSLIDLCLTLAGNDYYATRSLLRATGLHDSLQCLRSTRELDDEFQKFYRARYPGENVEQAHASLVGTITYLTMH